MRAIVALGCVLASSACVIGAGAGVTTRDGTKPITQIGMQTAFVFPQHVGPYLGLAYRDTDGDGATVLQGGVRIEKHRASLVGGDGPHGRIGAQRRFDDGDRSATGGFAAIGYHWDIMEVELEYVRERDDTDVMIVFGIDIGLILGAASGAANR